MMYGSALLLFREEGWLAQSRNGHFRPCDPTSITNCASTPVKLICSDMVTQHYCEFDQKLSGGRRFGHRLWFFLCQPLIEAFETGIGAGGDLGCLSELEAEQGRACLTDLAEPYLARTRAFHRVKPGKAATSFVNLSNRVTSPSV